MSSNGRNRGYIGRNEITSPKGVIDGRQQYLNEEINNWNIGTDWVRPIEWLSIPGYTSGQQIVYGLLAITDDELDSNSIGMQCSGAYNVNWGDGTTGSFSSAGIARKQYNYNSISTTSGTTSLGYKQVLVTVTPQSGSNLTSVNFGIQGVTGASTFMQGKWLEFTCNLPSCTSLTLVTIGASNPWLKKVNVTALPTTSTALDRSLNAPNLESVYYPPNWRPTNIQSAFLNNKNLRQAPYIETSLVTSMNASFRNSGILNVPPYNYSSVTNAISIFQECYDLKSCPFVLTMPVLSSNSNSIFSNCSKLEYVKGLSLPNATTMASCFQSNTSLKEVGDIFIPKITTIQNMFLNCVSLEKLGTITGGTGIVNANSAFSGTRLKTAPTLDLRNCTTATSMFFSNQVLENVPGYTFGNNATLAGMFSTCYSLKKLPSMNFNNIAVVDSGSGEQQRFTYFCYNLESFPVKNLRVSMSLLNCRFGFTALSEVFAGLTGISGPSATLIITGNPGASGITAGQIAGATAKGWTITL